MAQHLYKRGPSWYYEFEHKKKRYVGCLGQIPLTAAKVKVANIYSLVHQGLWSKPKADATLREFTTEFMLYYQAKNKPSTVITAEKRLKANILPALGHKRLRELSQKDMEDYKAARHNAGRADATVNLELILLQTMLRKAVERGYIATNPVSRVKLYRLRNQRIRYLSEDEEARLWAVCNPKLRPVVMLALHTGLRQREVMLLGWEDIDLKQCLLRVRAEHDKGGAGGYLPLNRHALGALVGLWEKSGQPVEGRVFDFRSQDTLRVSFWWLCHRANIKDFHFHDLRHTFASRLAMKGIPLRTIQELLRHHDITMTLRYAHLSPSHLKQSVEVLE